MCFPTYQKIIFKKHNLGKEIGRQKLFVAMANFQFLSFLRGDGAVRCMEL